MRLPDFRTVTDKLHADFFLQFLLIHLPWCRRRFVHDLADNMRQAASAKGMPAADYEIESEAMLSLLITYIIDALNLPKEQRKQRLQRVEKQLQMLVAGA